MAAQFFSFWDALPRGYPVDCDACLPQDALPTPDIIDTSLTNFISTLSQELYTHFICVPRIWKWALFYACLQFTTSFFLRHIYYPYLFRIYAFNTKTLAQLNSSKLSPARRAPISANKLVSLTGAVVAIAQCITYMSTPSSTLSTTNLWNSIYIPCSADIMSVLDVCLGYYVFDSLYITLVSFRWMYLLHHAVVPLAVIGVKSIGFGCEMGIPILLTADATTLVLNVMWFAQERALFVRFGMKHQNYQKMMGLEATAKQWEMISVVLKIVFGVTFLYLRLVQLPYVCVPWVWRVVMSVHCNAFYKGIAVVGNGVLLGTGYVWAWDVLRIIQENVRGVLKSSRGVKVAQAPTK